MKTDLTKQQFERPILFWFLVFLIALMPIYMLSRDITKPFCGLHSWGEAHYAWVAKSHVKYGLSYTKGFDTFAVGDPPAANPDRYLDHPQLLTLIHAASMAIFGINTWAIRLINIIATVLSLFIFVRILRGLLDDFSALVGGLLFAMFPLFGYFGIYGMWFYPVSLLAFWSYLVLIRSLKNESEPSNFHRIVLGISLFMAIQLSWEGFFYAFAIGVHYVFRCIHRRKLPDMVLLSILVIPPLISLILNFTTMAAGHDWNFQRIVDLYKWRAGGGEKGTHNWPAWFGRLWEFAVLNFSLAVLITAIVYLTIGQLAIWTAPASGERNWAKRRFPQFWLFLMPPIFQLFLLKGALWPHQYWERPMAPFIAIAATMGVMLLADVLKLISRKLAIAGVSAILLTFLVFCIIGTNYYNSIAWQPMAKLNMFKMLNEKIPPDKALLSMESFVVDQHKNKQASYRPEIAWYLDRDIVVAGVFDKRNRILVKETVDLIKQKNETGKYPYYLIPHVEQLMTLISELSKFYEYQVVEGHQGERTKDGKFLKAGMYNYVIFDLKGKAAPDQQLLR